MLTCKKNLLFFNFMLLCSCTLVLFNTFLVFSRGTYLETWLKMYYENSKILRKLLAHKYSPEVFVEGAEHELLEEVLIYIKLSIKLFLFLLLSCNIL